MRIYSTSSQLQILTNFLGFTLLYLSFTIFLIDYDTLGKNVNYFTSIPKQMISHSVYLWLSRTIYSILGLYLIVCLYLLKKKRINIHYLTQIYATSGEYFRNFIQTIFHLSKTEKIILFFLFFGILGYRIFMLLWIPFESDELKSLVFFIRFPPTFPLRWYHGLSNNHILFVFIANLLDKTGLDYFWVLRLPSLIASMTAIVLFYHFIYIRFGFTQALVFVLIFNALFPFQYYSIIGRGYAFHILFASLGFMAIYRIVLEEQPDHWYFGVLAISSILGLYTAPSYLYFFLICYAIIFLCYINDLSVVRQVVLSGAWVICGVLFLYTPILLANSWGTMINSGHSDFRIYSFSEIMSRFLEIYRRYVEFYFGSTEWSLYIFILVFMGLVYLVLKNPDKTTRKLAFILIIIQMMPIFFLFTHRVIAFPRIWTVMHVINAMACFTILRTLKIKHISFLLLFILIISQYYFFIRFVYYEPTRPTLTLTGAPKVSPQQFKDILQVAEKLKDPLESKAKIGFYNPPHVFYFSLYLLKNNYSYHNLLGFQVVAPEEAEYLIEDLALDKSWNPSLLKNFKEFYRNQSFRVYKRISL